MERAFVGLSLFRLLVLLSLCAPSPGVAQPAKTGPELVVNSFTDGLQQYPDVAVDAAGRFVVAWASYDQDGSYGGIFAQRFDAQGTPASLDDFQVNETSTGDQYFPAVATDPNGNFVVVWTSYFQDGDDLGVFAQRYDAQGNPLGAEFQVNTFTSYYQGAPAVAADSNGNFVITWMSELQDEEDFGIFAQRYDAQGAPVGSEFQVNERGADYQGGPSVSFDAQGSFVVAWSSFSQDGDGYGVFARRFANNGTPVGGEIQLNSTVAGDQQHPSVAAFGEGNFVVAWTSEDQDGDRKGVVGRRFSMQGATGPEFQVNTQTTEDQTSPAIASAADGRFAVVWTTDAEAQGTGIAGRYFSATGQPVSAEFPVNAFTGGEQQQPSIDMEPDGDFVVVWTSDGQDGDATGIVAQRFTAPSIVAACPGDCDGSRQVTVDELVRGVNIALGSAALATCPEFDVNSDALVTVSELVTAVNAALGGCP